MEIHNFWPNRYTVVNVFQQSMNWMLSEHQSCFPSLKTEDYLEQKILNIWGIVRFTDLRILKNFSYCVSVNIYCFGNKDYILKHKIYNKHSFRHKTADIISLAYLWKTYEWKWKKHITESIMEIVFMRNIFCSHVILSDMENFEWAFG